MRIFKYGIFGLFALLVVIQLVLWINTWFAQDRDFAHSNETRSLPLFSDDTNTGLVRIEANGFEFRARVSGFEHQAPKGNLVLLHGFPETSIMWIPLIEAASSAGYRVVAFDQRGYSPDARPVGRDQYTGNALVGDALAVADAVGFQRFHLVGHDWGAAVGWQVVFAAADRLNSWTALSIPHVVAFGDAVANDPEQGSKSRYMAFFWLPFLPESVFGFRDFSLLKGFYADHPAAEVAEYLAVLREPGAMTGALNWYRAPFGGDDESDQTNRDIEDSRSPIDIVTPTLFIWGNQDPAVGAASVAGQVKFMKGPYREVEIETGHWLMATATEQVVSETMKHIAAN